ncbi:MAG: alpha/beta hydrolase [Sphingobium sp.]|nr:alpha/beta hydrolase [Sphingobium sp.]
MSAPQRVDHLRALGTKISPEMLQQTMALFAPYAARPDSSSGIIRRDVAYGDHERHRLDIFAPHMEEEQGLPVVVFVHGGGFVGGDKGAEDALFYNNIGAWAVRHGMVGVTLRYRLAPSSPWPAGAEDIAQAVQWLRNHIQKVGGDTGRIVAMGQSAGAAHVAGYIAHPDLDAEASIAGAIMMSGIYDLETLAHSPLENAYYGTDSALFAERSSLTGLVRTSLPCLFTLSEFDPDSFQMQAERVVHENCRVNGRWPRMRYLSGHNHLSPALILGELDDPLSAELADFIKSV